MGSQPNQPVPPGGDESPGVGKSASIAPPPPTPAIRGGLSTECQASPVGFDLLETFLTKLAIVGSVKFVLSSVAPTPFRSWGDLVAGSFLGH